MQEEEKRSCGRESCGDSCEDRLGRADNGFLAVFVVSDFLGANVKAGHFCVYRARG
jgi:hypothetical protein